MSEQGEKWQARLSVATEGLWEVYRRITDKPEEVYLVKFHYMADELAAYLNALEAELEQLRPRAALADEALAKQPIGARWVWVMDEAGVCADCGIDWPGEDGEHDPECILSRYDALPPSQGEGA